MEILKIALSITFTTCIVLIPLLASADDVTVGGAYLGLFNYIDQTDAPDDYPKRTQFDFAVNVDVEWEFAHNIIGTAQLQGGPGEGSLGFVGPGAEVTDLNVTYFFKEPDLSITAGSFDTPFGAQTSYLSNNGDATANPFVMNSLFYSAFAGGPVGTLNTLGVMGELDLDMLNFTLAVTNGTDEVAENSDGNFEVTGRAIFTPPGIENLHAAGSFIYSDDNSASGATGSGSELMGFMGEVMFAMNELSGVKGYFGQVTYDDAIENTDDKVTIYMGEVKFGIKKWYVAGRFSGWDPEDSDANGQGASALIPHPGLAMWPAGTTITDIAIYRTQLGAGYFLRDDLVLKANFFLDDYREKDYDGKLDVSGIILSLNGTF